MCLRLLDRLDELVGVGTHGALRHVHVVVGHHQHTKVFLLGLFAAGLELRHRADGRGLGGLSAGVGVHLGIHQQHVHILAHGEHVIQTAVADVIRPAVAAVHPHGLFGHILLALEDLVHDGLLLGGELGALQQGYQRFGGGGGGVQILVGLQPLGDGRLNGGVLRQSVQLLDVAGDTLAQLLDRQTHTVGELGVVFKQGVGPCHALALGVLAVRDAGHGRAPCLGAAGGVGKIHLVAEHLGQQLDVGRLAAAGAGTVELHQRLLELAALQGEFVHAGGLFLHGGQEVPAGLLQRHLVGGHHLQSLTALGAGGYAAAAGGAVQRGHAHGVLQAVQTGTLGVHQRHVHGSRLDLTLVQQERADDGMGADEGAHIALEALGGVPHRQMGGDAALLIAGGAQRHGAVLHTLEGGDGQIVALLCVDGHEDVLDNVGQVLVGGLQRLVGEVRPLGLYLDLHQRVDAGVHGGDVHVDDLLALETVGLFDGVLHVSHSVLHGDDVRQLEEGGLQHHVGAVAQTQCLRLLIGVDDVELDVVVGDVLEDLAGDVLLQLVLRPLAVQQEAAMGLQLVDDVVLGQIRLVMAGDEVRVGDVVRGADGVFAEAQVALGDAEGLLGVVLEVRLTVHIRRLADDLDGVLVGTHRTVGAETPELAGDGALRLGEQRRAHGQGQMGHIVHDADGEVVLRLIQQQIVEYGLDLGGGGVLAAETVASGIDGGTVALVDIGGADVLVQRLADGADLLDAVEDGDLLHRLGHGRHQVLAGEGAEQVHLQEAHLLALGVQMVDDLLGTAAHGAHGDDDALGVGCAVVVEQVVLPTGQLADLRHVALHDVGQLGIGGVVGLAQLEVDVGVIYQRTHTGILRIQGVGAEGGQRVAIHQLGVLVVAQHVDLLDLVAGTEAIEEVQERDTRLDGTQMRHSRQICRLLDAAAGQQGEARLTAVHHVGVVAEDGEGVGTHGAGRHVQHAGQTLAGDAVQGGDHQHQALRGGEAGGQRTGLQRAVTGTAGTGLGLHLHQTNRLTEDVLFAGGRPRVGVLRHGAGRGDGIDGCDLGERIGYVCRRLVTVADLHDLAHRFSSSSN